MIEEFKPPDSFVFDKQKIIYVGDSDIAPDGKKMWRKMHVYEYETGYKKGQKEYFSSGNIPWYISQEKQTL